VYLRKGWRFHFKGGCAKKFIQPVNVSALDERMVSG